MLSKGPRWPLLAAALLVVACGDEQAGSPRLQAVESLAPSAPSSDGAEPSYAYLDELRVNDFAGNPIIQPDDRPIGVDVALDDCGSVQREWDLTLPSVDGYESTCFVDLIDAPGGSIRPTPNPDDVATIGRVAAPTLAPGFEQRTIEELLDDGFTVIYAEIGSGPHPTPDEFEQALREEYGQDVVVEKPDFALVPLDDMTLDVRRPTETRSIVYWDDRTAAGTPVVMSARSAAPPSTLVSQLASIVWS